MYLQNTKDISSLAVNNVKTDTFKNKPLETAYVHKSLPSQELVKEEEKVNNEKNALPQLTIVEQDALFASNFEVDKIPGDVPPSLTYAFYKYENKDYKKAT